MTVSKIIGENNIRLCLEGRLDAITVIEFRKILDESLTENIRSVIFDFKNLDYISSSGLRVVLYAYKRMIDYGEFMIFNACGFVLEVLESSGFTNMIILDNDIIEENIENLADENADIKGIQEQKNNCEEEQIAQYQEIVSGPMVKISLEDEDLPNNEDDVDDYEEPNDDDYEYEEPKDDEE